MDGASRKNSMPLMGRITLSKSQRLCARSSELTALLLFFLFILLAFFFRQLDELRTHLLQLLF